VTEENPKKATDILVEINQKVDKLLGMVANHDLLLKTLNNKLNKTNIPTENLNIPQVPLKTNIPGLKPGVVLGPNGLEQKEIVSDDEFVQVNTDHLDAEIQKSNGKKVAVQQRVTYADGSNICLANVEITGNNLKAPKKLKTNAMGKWLIALEPGQYVVAITKSANKNKQGIAISMNITIPESDKPVELPQLTQ